MKSGEKPFFEFPVSSFQLTDGEFTRADGIVSRIKGQKGLIFPVSLLTCSAFSAENRARYGRANPQYGAQRRGCLFIPFKRAAFTNLGKIITTCKGRAK